MYIVLPEQFNLNDLFVKVYLTKYVTLSYEIIFYQASNSFNTKLQGTKHNIISINNIYMLFETKEIIINFHSLERQSVHGLCIICTWAICIA